MEPRKCDWCGRYTEDELTEITTTEHIPETIEALKTFDGICEICNCELEKLKRRVRTR